MYVLGVLRMRMCLCVGVVMDLDCKEMINTTGDMQAEIVWERKLSGTHSCCHILNVVIF